MELTSSLSLEAIAHFSQTISINSWNEPNFVSLLAIFGIPDAFLLEIDPQDNYPESTVIGVHTRQAS
jgi:hypothetical protein